MSSPRLRHASPLLVLLALAACNPVKSGDTFDAQPGPGCTSNAQCSAPTSICATDGVCVGCEGASDCGPGAPVCDPSARACRGCTADSECPGGICVEASGACVADGDTAFVTMMGQDPRVGTPQAPPAPIKNA